MKNITFDLTLTHGDSIYTFSAQYAPQDVNGNTRTDINVIKDGETYRNTIKGFRKVRNGYRTQLGSHGYSHEQACKDLFDAIVAEEAPKAPTKNQNGTNRSTGKETKEQIREHIIEALSEECGDTVPEQLEAVAKGFMSWYGPYEQKRIPNIQAAFINWLQGLPSCFNVEFETYKQEEMLNKWLGESPKNYTDDVIEQRYYYLIFREFNKLCTLNGVDSLFKRL